MKNWFLFYYSLYIMEHKDNSDNDSVCLLPGMSVYVPIINVYFRNIRHCTKADHCST